MDTRRPQKTYAVLLLATVLQVAFFVTEQWGTNTNWWTSWTQTWPMGLIWALTAAFVLGLLIQDATNKQSWLWANWRYWTRKFDVQFVIVAASIQRDHLAANVQIRFVRRVKSGELILRVFGNTGKAQRPMEHVIKLETLSRVQKGETKVIELAKRAIPSPGWTPIHSTWGPGVHGGMFDIAPSLILGSKNVAQLELIGGWVTQRHRFFVVVPQYGSSQDMPALYVQSEDEDAFETKAKT